MAAKDALARIVRSKDFARSTPEQQQDFVIGYLANQQPSIDHRAAFSQFDDARQRQIADEAIRRTAEPSTGEIAQHAVEQTARVAGPMAATAGLSGAGPVTAAAVPAAMISEFAPEVTRPFLTGQAADLAGALERSAESGLLAGVLGPVEKVGGMLGKAAGGLRSRLMGTRSFKDPKTGKMIEDPDVTAARSVLEPRGGGLTLGQQHGSGRGFFENLSRNAILGEGKFARLDLTNEKAIDQFADEVAAKIGNSMPAEQLGIYARDHVAKGHKLAREAGGALFTQVDNAAGGIQTIQDDALDFLDVTAKLPGMKKVFASFNAGRTGGKKGIEELLGRTGNGFAKFGDAELAASELFAAYRELKKRGEVGAANLAAKLGGMVRRNIDTALDQLDPTLRAQADNARQFWKDEVVDTYETEVMRGLVKQLAKTPGQLPLTLINGGIDTLKAAKKAMNKTLRDAKGNIIQDGTPTWPEAQKSILGSLLVGATDPVKGIFSDIRKLSGRQLMQRIQSLDAGNSQYIKTLTDGSTTIHDFQRLATAIDKAGLGVEGSGGVFMRLKQAQAVGTAGSLALGASNVVDPGIAVTGAGAIIVAPWLMAKWFTNRQAMHNLAEGLIGGPKSQAFRRVVALATAESDKSREFVREHFGDIRPKVRDAAPGAAQSLKDLIAVRPQTTLDSQASLRSP